MKKPLTILALCASPMAFAAIDAGTVDCRGVCGDPNTTLQTITYGIMDNLNCNGHGHTASGGAFCNLSNGASVKVKVLYDSVPNTTYWQATRISQVPAVWQLSPGTPPAEVFRVYYLPVCVGAYIDTYSYMEAQSVEGGISFTIFLPPDEPEPGICWDVAVILDP